MAGESNADVYASFGVNSAVMSGSTVSEHEQNMLSLDVSARDGDDAITLGSDKTDPYDTTDPFGQEDDEGRMQVRVGDGSEGAEEETEAEGEAEETTEGNPEGNPEEGNSENDEEFKPLGDAPKELVAATEQLGEHETGFQEMIATAVDRGMTQEVIDRIQAEYDTEEGISKESYEELAKVGYTRAFVDSYIRGQEALVEQYVNSIMDYAGGRDSFNTLYKHLETHNPEAAASLTNALESRDLSTVKAIINLAGESRSKSFGRKPTRSVTNRATPAKPAAPKVQGFASRDEMVKAMSDARYRTDASYRREVEQKVVNSHF